MARTYCYSTFALLFLFTQHVQADNSFVNLGNQLSELNQARSSQFSICTDYISTCPPTITNCVNPFCEACTGLAKTVDSCCRGPNAPSCFAGLKGGAPLTAAPSSTSINPNSAACGSIVNIVSSCEAATSDFDNLSNAAQASCLCYASSTWQPDVFDGFIGSCAAFASTADTLDLLGVQSVLGLCSSAGNVLSLTSAPATSTPSNTVRTNGKTSTPTATSAGPAATSSKSGAGMVTIDAEWIMSAFMAWTLLWLTWK